MDAEALLTKLQSRYACKKFDPSRKIDERTWQVLEEALRLSPSSLGLQPWKFIVIQDPALRSSLRPHAADQNQITSASHLVAIATRTNLTEKEVEAHVAQTSSVRSVSIESLKGYEDSMKRFINTAEFQPVMPQWAARQGYLALGFLLEAAAVLDLDACPMEGFDADAFDKVLALKDGGFTTTVLCAVGYHSADDEYKKAKKVRFPKENVFEYR